MKCLRNTLVYFAIASILPHVACAQTQTKKAEPAQSKKDETKDTTKFEQFLSRKGELVIKDFYEVGVLHGKSMSAVKITAATLYLPGGSSEKVYAVKLEVPTTRQYGSDQVAVLDYDEVTSLIDALKYVFLKLLKWQPSSESIQKWSSPPEAG